MKRDCANVICPNSEVTDIAFQSSTTTARAAIALHASRVTRVIEILARFMVILLSCQFGSRAAISRAEDMGLWDPESQEIPRNASGFCQGAIGREIPLEPKCLQPPEAEKGRRNGHAAKPGNMQAFWSQATK